MKVAVVGGGAAGAAIRRALEERDVEVAMHSRATGFDVLRDDAATTLRDADAIIEATGRFTLSRRAATGFFTHSTRAIAHAARTSGARHVLLSIVNAGLPEVQGYGYFAGKTAQERVAREESERLTIVRSTQWFEFAEQNLDRMAFGPIAFVPSMTIRPVALDAVADVVADCVVGRRPGELHEVAGPETATLWDMTAQLPDKRVRPVPVSLPGRWGRAFRDGTLIPAGPVDIVGPSYPTWLAAR